MYTFGVTNTVQPDLGNSCMDVVLALLIIIKNVIILTVLK
jgi:hypothetical protein